MQKKLIWILAALAAVIIAGVILVNNTANAKLSRILESTLAQEPLSLELTVDAAVGGETTAFSSQLDRVPVGNAVVTRIGADGYYLYEYQNIVFFENGNAYQIEDADWDYGELLNSIVKVCRYLDITRTKEGSQEIYSLTATEEAVSAFVRFLVPTGPKALSGIPSLDVEFFVSDGRLSSIQLRAKGEADGQPYAVDAALVVCGTTEITIPNAICSAILQGDYSVTSVLSEELFRLIGAWYQLGVQETVTADLKLHAACGPLQLTQNLKYYQDNTEKPAISALQKDDLILYFTDHAICTADGTILTEGEASWMNASVLLGMAYALCLNGEMEIGEDIYECSLDEEAMQAIAAAIAPEVGDMNLRYESGTVRIELEDGTLKRIDFTITGSMWVLVLDVGTSITAELVFTDADFAVPDAVREALSES